MNKQRVHFFNLIFFWLYVLHLKINELLPTVLNTFPQSGISLFFFSMGKKTRTENMLVGNSRFMISLST